MPKNLLRTVGSFVAVVAAYWVYALVAVPLIEPTVRARERSQVTQNATANQEDAAEQLARQQLFPPGSWELEGPKVLETERGKLLFQDYKPLDDGRRMEVTPCTLISQTAGREAADGKPASPPRPIVMRAPQGAVLIFDRPIDLARADFGRLDAALLRGPIHIYSPESQPGAGDDLDLETRNVQIDQQHVLTPHDVKFRFGQHYGSGRNLTIDLIPNTKGGRNKGLSIAGAKSLELVHVDKLHLFVKGKGLLASDTNTGATTQAASELFASAPSPQATTPVEVTCRGPFQFDFAKNVASFEDNVDVIRLNPDGPSDQLTCQLLEIYFAAAGDQSPAPAAIADEKPVPAQAAKKKPMSSLSVRRIVAIGHPVILRALSVGAMAQGQRLEYDFSEQTIYLEDSDKVMLKHGSERVDAVALKYVLEPSGRLGQMWASGPGRLRRFDAAGKLAVDATWTDDATLLPHEGKLVVSVVGNANVKHVAMGNFQADEIHVWLFEIPRQPLPSDDPSKPHFDILPDKLLATGKVRFDSPQMSGRAKRMEAWFENRPVDAAAVQQLAGNPAGGVLGDRPASGNASSGQPPAQKFDVTGDLVRVELLQIGQETRIKQVGVGGKVHVVETQTAKPDELPLDITGETLEIVLDAAQLAAVQVRGAPATVAARGLTMAGEQVNLDQAQNQLWIDGPGVMTLPAQEPPANQATARTTPSRLVAADQLGTRVEWQGSMKFDGVTVRIRKQIAIHSLQTTQRAELMDVSANTQRLDITLTRRVDFLRAPEQKQPAVNVRLLTMDGGLKIESRTFDPAGTLTAIDQLDARNGLLDYLTGELRADGPGWAQTVRLGNDPLADRNRPAGTVDNSAASRSNALTFAHIDFQQGIVGDIYKKQVDFLHEVRAVYGPVERWDQRLDPNYRGGLGEHGVLLTCDRITVAEMGATVNGRRTLEMQALGNTHVESREFEADAERISFAEAKDLIVLEGNSRTYAELTRQAGIGGARDRVVAERILYWRRDGRVEMQGGRTVDLNQFGAFPGR